MDGSKLKYDISTLKGKQKVIEAFPELAEFTEFANPKHDLHLKITILITDDGSPFLQKERDFNKIVDKVFDYLAIKDRPLKDALKIGRTTLDTAIIYEMQYKYFMLLDNAAYLTWYSLFSFFHEMNMFMRTPLDPSDSKYEEKFIKKKTIMKELGPTQKELSDYERLVFQNTQIKKIVTKQIAKMINYPEKMARVYEV